MDKTHLLNISMVVQSLNVKNDIFHPKKNNEKLVGPDVPYLSTICALM